MRKYISLLLILLCFVLHKTECQKKDSIPHITIFHNKIVEDLPYGRKFYLVGDVPYFGDWKVDKMTITIYIFKYLHH